jgi:hypothetical protein
MFEEIRASLIIEYQPQTFGNEIIITADPTTFLLIFYCIQCFNNTALSNSVLLFNMENKSTRPRCCTT